MENREGQERKHLESRVGHWRKLAADRTVERTAGEKKSRENG